MKTLLVTLFLLIASVANAQPNTAGPCPALTTLAVNPGYVCITPASVAEHNMPNDPLTSTAVVRYDLLFFAPGVDTATAAPIQTINLGKPALNAAGVFWLQRAELGAIPVGQQYKARVVTVGNTTASGRSPESNPFGRSSTQGPGAPDGVVVVP